MSNDSQLALEQLASALRDYFTRQADVRLAYLHGSVVRGTTWAESDLDIAVWLEAAPTPYEQLHRSLSLMSEIDQLHLTRLEADVRLLNDAPLEFQWAVYYHGRCVFARDERERVDFETRVIRDYFDFKPILDEYYQGVIQRARTGEPSAESRRHREKIRARIARKRKTGELS